MDIDRRAEMRRLIRRVQFPPASIVNDKHFEERRNGFSSTKTVHIAELFRERSNLKLYLL